MSCLSQLRRHVTDMAMTLESITRQNIFNKILNLELSSNVATLLLPTDDPLIVIGQPLTPSGGESLT